MDVNQIMLAMTAGTMEALADILPRPEGSVAEELMLDMDANNDTRETAISYLAICSASEIADMDYKDLQDLARGGIRGWEEYSNAELANELAVNFEDEDDAADIWNMIG
jgi:hypothetical protein